MAVTAAHPTTYNKWVEDGDKICIMCGQHNSNEHHYCWYCGSSTIVLIEEADCVRERSIVPEEKEFMILDSWSELTERVEAYNKYQEEKENE